MLRGGGGGGRLRGQRQREAQAARSAQRSAGKLASEAKPHPLAERRMPNCVRFAPHTQDRWDDTCEATCADGTGHGTGRVVPEK